MNGGKQPDAWGKGYRAGNSTLRIGLNATGIVVRGFAPEGLISMLDTPTAFAMTLIKSEDDGATW